MNDDTQQQQDDDDAGLGSTKANEHYTKGLQHVKAGEYLAGFQSFSRAIFLLPDEPILYVARAEACMHLCDLSSAVTNYKKALSYQTVPDAAHTNRLAALLDCLGLLAFNSSRFERALTYFDTGLQYSSGNKPLRLHRSLALFMLGKEEDALRGIESCEGCEHCQPFVWVAKTVYNLKAELFVEGKDNLEKCLVMAPDLPLVNSLQMTYEAVFNKYKSGAVTSMEYGQWDDAIKKLNVCITAFPHDPTLYEMRSSCYSAKREYTAAVQDLFEGINKSGMASEESAARLAGTLTKIASELASKNAPKQSIDYCDEALKWFPNSREALLQRTECFKMLGDHDAAFSDLQRILKSNPVDPDAVWRLSELHASWGSKLYNNKRFVQAEREFAKAISSCPTEPLHRINHAKCLLMLRQPSEAIHELVECLRLNPADPKMIKTLKTMCPPDIYQTVQVYYQTGGVTPLQDRPLGASGILIRPEPPSGLAERLSTATKTAPLPEKTRPRKPRTTLTRDPIEPKKMLKSNAGTIFAEQPRKVLGSSYDTPIPLTTLETYSGFKDGLSEEVHSLRVGQSHLYCPYGITAIRGLAEQQSKLMQDPSQVRTTHWRGAGGMR